MEKNPEIKYEFNGFSLNMESSSCGFFQSSIKD